MIFGVLDAEPQITANLGFISDTANWVLITGCFIPQGGEIWMTIGNFIEEHLTEVDTNCPLNPQDPYYLDTYYYMDDVSVIDIVPEHPSYLQHR